MHEKAIGGIGKMGKVSMSLHGRLGKAYKPLYINEGGQDSRSSSLISGPFYIIPRHLRRVLSIKVYETNMA